MSNPSFINKYFVGYGIDIGGKPDPLSLYKELFCQLKGIKTWDWEDGDAQFLAGVASNSLDFIHSSHCLEHLNKPEEGLQNWFRVIKEGGHLIITVPDEDLYEQGQFPSTFNADHKWSFTIYKQSSWNEKSINVLDLIKTLDNTAELLKIELLHSTYRYDLPRFDQTLTPVGECGIELIIRKRTSEEMKAKGRWERKTKESDKEKRIHLNQYKNDHVAMKNCNTSQAPFSDDSEL